MLQQEPNNFICTLTVKYKAFLIQIYIMTEAGRRVAPDTELAVYPVNFLPDIRLNS